MPSEMSARHRRLQRFDTPPHYVRALTDVIGVPKGVIYEPCVGGGNILDGLDLHQCSMLWTNDLDKRVSAPLQCIRDRKDGHHIDAKVQHTRWDVRKPERWGTLGIDWCITNPPFKGEEDILRQALMCCKNVAFLARLSFLEPTISRRKFWRHWSVGCRVIVLPRYGFRPPSADNMTCVWLVWQRTQRAFGPATTVSWSRRRETRL